jgi:class 3 adenylate cyclase
VRAGFCLAEGPSAEAVEAVHREARDLIGSKVIEVDPAAVEAFLGQLDRPATGEPYVATAFRAVLFTDIVGSTELTQRLGDLGAMHVIRAHDAIVAEVIRNRNARRIKHLGDGAMASFSSVSSAVSAAIEIQAAVAELCLGKGFTFKDRGEVELKGFPEPMRVYEVVCT